jgi:pimeloyl-ACP methyl ester carboxylesterase
MQYLLNASSGAAPALDGAIMQAPGSLDPTFHPPLTTVNRLPASDREAIVMTTSKTAYLTSLNFCESWIKDAREKEILPREMRPRFEDTPISAERWYSLAAPLDANGKPQGSEDFFSSDLDDATLAETFGKIPKDTPVLALYGGKDHCVPPEVDKETLLGRWNSVAEAAGANFKASVVPGATHDIADVSTEVLEDFVGRVSGFLESIAKGNGD